MYDGGSELIRSAQAAVRPWESIDSVMRDYRGSLRLVLKSDLDEQDTQAQIDKCLNCKRMFCTNCLDPKEHAYVPKSKMVPVQCNGQMAMEL